MNIKTASKFWLQELNAGTIAGAVKNNPAAAVEFFGSLPVLRMDGNELMTIAGAAWQSVADDSELKSVQETASEMLGSTDSLDEIRESARITYEGGKLGSLYSSFRGDGSLK